MTPSQNETLFMPAHVDSSLIQSAEGSAPIVQVIPEVASDRYICSETNLEKAEALMVATDEEILGTAAVYLGRSCMNSFSDSDAVIATALMHFIHTRKEVMASMLQAQSANAQTDS
jgi:hypothetical protein